MKKVTGTISAMPVGLAAGLGVSAVITLAGSALTAWLIGRESIPESAAGYGALAILMISSVTGAAMSWRRIRHRRMLVCLLSAGVYYLSLLCVTALFFGGQYQGMAVTALVVLGGSMTFGLLGLRGQARGYSRRRKIR